MKLINPIFLSAILFLGCSRAVYEDNIGKNEIYFHSNVQKLLTVNVSRVDKFNSGDKMHLYIAERENADVVAIPASEDLYEMSYKADGSLAFADEGEHYYPDMPIDVYGYYWRMPHTAPQNLGEMAVNVEIDQTAEEKLDKSDFLYTMAAKGFAKDVKPIELQFEHLFSKITLNITTETPSTIDFSKLENVKLHDMVTEGTFNLGIGTLTNGKTSDEILMTVSKSSSAIVLPQTIEENKKLFSFKLEGNEEEFEINVAANNFEKGKEYTYNVKVNKYPGMGSVEMQFSVSVKDWISEEYYEIVVEKGEKVEINLTDVAMGVNISKTDLYLASGEFKRELKDISVVNNKMKFIFPRLSEGGALQLVKARFYTDAGEQFDYYFRNVELKGNNYDKIVLSIPKIGDAWGGGTIFVVGKVIKYDEVNSEFETNTNGINAYRGRVVANSSIEKKLEWCSNNNVTVGATDENDGSKNMEAVKNYVVQNNKTLEMFPAFKACEDMGEGWYYPAINELKCIIAHKDELGEDVNLNSSSYGSSTEKGSDNLCVGGNSTKNTDVEVRAVRAY